MLAKITRYVRHAQPMMAIVRTLPRGWDGGAPAVGCEAPRALQLLIGVFRNCHEWKGMSQPSLRDLREHPRAILAVVAEVAAHGAGVEQTARDHGKFGCDLCQPLEIEQRNATVAQRFGPAGRECQRLVVARERLAVARQLAQRVAAIVEEL